MLVRLIRVEKEHHHTHSNGAYSLGTECYFCDQLMINYETFFLDNGLEVIVHEDPGTSIVCLNTLYKVGSRNEDPSKTGFAHLFEHLMFGGSKNIENFDEPLQAVGGENNAFTNTDITNYYTTVPSNNVETAFWLESDRMLGLSFNPRVLEVQRNVVIEEFKQRYLNQPYGDVWHQIRPVAFQKHPYQWPTIGREVRQIEEATMEDVKGFFDQYYHPGNAILVIAGDITLEKARQLTQKWYGDIPGRKLKEQTLPKEVPQDERRKISVEKDVPADMIYKCYHMPARTDQRYYASDLLSDVLGRGKSSRLYHQLVKEQELFTNLQAYVQGTVDPGLLVISGQLKEGIPMEEADNAIDRVISEMENNVTDQELTKAKNLAISSLAFGEVELLNRSMNLAFSSFLGDTSLVNKEQENIQSVTVKDIESMRSSILRKDNETVLYYKKKAS
jgi:zinc protease